MKVTVDIIGRLTKDPQTKENSNVTMLSVVANRKRNGVEMTDYFNCFARDRQAEFAQKYLKKGRLVSISGELTFSMFNEKVQKNISVHQLTSIDTRETEALPQQPARRANTQSARQTAPASKTNPQPASRPAPPTPDPVFLSDDEDDDQQDDDDNSIPF
jgi:single-strand DNA-binding protein